MAIARRYILRIALISTLLTPAAATAHRLKAAISTVTVVASTGNMEIIHRFYSHDAEHALSSITGQRADVLQDEASQQAFGRFVSERFMISDQDEKELPLSLLGVELEGDFIWVYQETPIPAHLTGLEVQNSALLEEVPGQVNTVNIECGSELETLVFSGTFIKAGVEMDFTACVGS